MKMMNKFHLGLTFQSGIGSYNIDNYKIEEWFQKQIQNHNNNIISFINKYGELSADEILKKIFPTPPQANIFISHSHDDIDEAKMLAFTLANEFHENVFIDEYVWGSADNLLDQINLNAYDVISDTYDIDQSCLNASSIYILLANAISKVIHQCKFFIFLKSHNSLGCLTPGHTRSPWIYFELQLINDIIKNEERIINQWAIIKEASSEQMNFSEIAFPADYKSFPSFTYKKLKQYLFDKKIESISNKLIDKHGITLRNNFFDFYTSL